MKARTRSSSSVCWGVGLKSIKKRLLLPRLQAVALGALGVLRMLRLAQARFPGALRLLVLFLLRGNGRGGGRRAGGVDERQVDLHVGEVGEPNIQLRAIEVVVGDDFEL